MIRKATIVLALGVLGIASLLLIDSPGMTNARTANAEDEPVKTESPSPKSESEKTAPAEKDKKAASVASVGGLPGADPGKTGAIEGVVVFTGDKVPELPGIEVQADHRDANVCGQEIPQEKLVLDAGKHIANVVVSLADTKVLPKAKPRDVRLTNEACVFKPHVVAAPVRSRLVVGSRDSGVIHTAHGYLGNDFNISVPRTDRDVPIRLKSKTGYTLLKCDTHAWMQAHLWTFRHDFFAVTGTDGRFRLEGVPVGDYEVEIWHEFLVGILQKPILKKVSVRAGETATLKVELKERAAK